MERARLPNVRSAIAASSECHETDGLMRSQSTIIRSCSRLRETQLLRSSAESQKTAEALRGRRGRAEMTLPRRGLLLMEIRFLLIQF